jgi:hypothetical protein
MAEDARTAAGKQLANQFSRVHDAFMLAYKKRQEQLKVHGAVMESLPDEPERGSYYWWARQCRQNTGSSLCDSGYAYGYQYMRGVLPEEGSHLHLYMLDGKPEYWSINLPKYLETMFDASGEVSEAIEQVLYWVGLWLYPREPWGEIIQELPDILRCLYACIRRRSDDVIVLRKAARRAVDENRNIDKDLPPMGVANVVGWRLRKIVYRSDLRSWQQGLSDEEYIKQALDDFPTNAMKRLYDSGVGEPRGWDVYDNPGKFYTYNHDNSLNQDYMVDLWLSDNNSDLHAVIRTHNGCDARGGFSSPRVAAVNDAEYLSDYDVRHGQCRFCQGDYWDMYHYGKEVEKTDGPVFDIDAIRRRFELYEQMEAGQLRLFEVAYQELSVNEDHAVAILGYHDRLVADEEEVEYPSVMLCVRDENEIHYFLDKDARGSVPDDMVEGLWCPNCGQYGVQFWTSVYGF